MKLMTTLCYLLMFAICSTTTEEPDSPFHFQDDGSALTVFENDQPVLTFLYTRTNPPEEMDLNYWRSNYIHPLYGLDGDILTDDFPEDHPHHRGIFWSWADVTYGDRQIDPWALRGVRQLFRDWIEREITSSYAHLMFESGWRLDEDWEPFIKERISIRVHPSDETGRAIDFYLHFRNISSKVVTLRGQGDSGYGGFNIRPDGNRPDIRITTAEGEMDDDALVVESGWADLSSRISENEAYSGVSIFQHPDNPDFPHNGWILRYYGFLGASWPQYERIELNPNDDLQISYRVYVHRGDAETASVARQFDEYIREISKQD